MKKNRYQSKKRITNYNYVNYISKLLEDITDIDPFENTRRLETQSTSEERVDLW